MLLDAMLVEEAAGLLRQALGRDATSAERRLNLAAVLRMSGDVAEAAALADEALAAAPDLSRGYHLLADLDPGAAARHRPAMLRLAADPALGAEARAQLRYAVARLDHEAGAFGAAVAQVSEGAALLRRQRPYRVEDDLLTMATIRETQTRAALAAVPDGGETRRAILVCGLPRSGTTLVEQMLLRHGGLGAAGESPALSQAIQRGLAATGGAAGRREMIARLAGLDRGRLGRTYLDLVAPSVGRAGPFVDKALLNFLAAGLVQGALPNARVLILRRDPRDCLASIYRTFFGGLYPFALDPIALARYIRAFRDLVRHWADTLDPARVHVADYEPLVADPMAGGRRVYAAAGLDWTAAALDPARRTGAVSASAVQVRQPVTDRSVGGWRAYAPWLGEALALLDEP